MIVLFSVILYKQNIEKTNLSQQNMTKSGTSLLVPYGTFGRLWVKLIRENFSFKSLEFLCLKEVKDFSSADCQFKPWLEQTLIFFFFSFFFFFLWKEHLNDKKMKSEHLKYQYLITIKVLCIRYIYLHAFFHVQYFD